MILKLAWRNLWRNKRRTAITLASVFFAVILATLMMSIKYGVYKNMTESMVASYTGFVQIHANGYWESKSIDDAFVLSDSLKDIINSNHKIGKQEYQRMLIIGQKLGLDRAPVFQMFCKTFG